MSSVISYRGKIKDLRQIETFEDRIIELAVEFGGYERIWRTSNEENPPRILRGVLLDLAPGLETISLLISPEGVLIPINKVKDAERKAFKEPPWCKVDTQFASLEAHVMLVELLATLRDVFFPDLEIVDKSGYWDARDLSALRKSHKSSGVLDAKAIAKLAERVRRTVKRPPEHPPVHFDDSKNDELDSQCYGTEEEWEAFFKENERKQAGLMRAFEESNLQGVDPGESFEAALRSEGIVDLPEFEEGEREGIEVPDDLEFGDDEEGEEWKGEADDDLDADDDEELDDDEEAEERPTRKSIRDKHPLMKRMTKLTLKVMKLPERNKNGPGGFFDPLMKGIFEMSGGLAQVFSASDDHDTPYGLVLNQLKRAHRGARFARGALVPAHELGMVSDSDFKHIQDEVDFIEAEIKTQMDRTRKSLRGELE